MTAPDEPIRARQADRRRLVRLGDSPVALHRRAAEPDEPLRGLGRSELELAPLGA